MEMCLRISLSGFLVGLGLSLGACARREQPLADTHPLYVPSTMVVQQEKAGTRELALSPYQILPASDAEIYFVPRPEKFAFGQTVYAESTAFSIYTYDQQLISNLWGPSYRYRWIEQSGLTSP